MSYASGKASLQKQIMNDFKAIAQSREDTILYYLTEKEKFILAYTMGKFVPDTLEKINKDISESVKLTEELSEYLLKEKLPIDLELQSVFIVNSQGRIIASTTKSNIGIDMSADHSFVEGKKNPYLNWLRY